jgi:hydroxymethylpyrimidine pyrophosphatase-like HAD family hydrolase
MKNTTLFSKLLAQRRQGSKKPFILFSDIDRTFILEEGSLDERAQYRQATEEIIRLLEDNFIPLVLVTGNDFPMVQDYIAQNRLQTVPDAVVAAVGSEIYLRQESGEFLPDHFYSAYMQKIFPRNTQVDEQGEKLPGIYPEVVKVVRKVRNKFPFTDFDFQPRDTVANVRRWGNHKKMVAAPQPYKISLKASDTYLDPETKSPRQPEVHKYVTQQLAKLEARLQELGYKSVSVSRIPGPGYDDYDIAIGKDVAVHYLLKQLGEVRAAFAGDSLNDLQALQSEQVVPWVVGGARQSLLDKLKDTAGRDDVNHATSNLRGPQSILDNLKKLVNKTCKDT